MRVFAGHVNRMAFEDTSPFSAAFYDALKSEDDLGRILKAHLYIERELWTLVLAAAVHPDAFAPSQRWGFERLAKIAVAMGLAEEFLPPLLKLNRIRNEFAHHADRVLSADDFTSVWSSCSEEFRKRTRESYARAPIVRTVDAPPFDQLPHRERLTFAIVTLRATILIAQNAVRPPPDTAAARPARQRPTSRG